MVEVNDVTGLCNTVYSFFLRQIYWHIPVKMELWSSIVVSLCRLQFSLDNLYLVLASTGLCCSLVPCPWLTVLGVQEDSIHDFMNNSIVGKFVAHVSC